MAKETESLAQQAADRVRDAVEGAETEAREIVARAEREAERIRDAAETEARQRLEQAQQAVERLVRQADELRSALGHGPEVGKAESPKQGRSEVPAPEVDPTPATVPEPEPVREPEPTPPATPEPEPPSEPEPQPVEVPEPSPPQPGSSEQGGPTTEQLIKQLKGGAAPGAGDSADEQGARLVAMKMALEGKPRDEVERHLAHTHAIADPGPLLDDVYSRVGR